MACKDVRHAGTRFSKLGWDELGVTCALNSQRVPITCTQHLCNKTVVNYRVLKKNLMKKKIEGKKRIVAKKIKKNKASTKELLNLPQIISSCLVCIIPKGTQGRKARWARDLANSPETSSSRAFKCAQLM